MLRVLALLLLASLGDHAWALDAEACQRIDDEGQKAAAFRPPLGGRVVALGRSGFFSAPDAGCPMKEFLVTGDTVVIYVPYKDWYQVSFVNRKTLVEVSGWMRADRIKVAGTMGLTN